MVKISVFRVKGHEFKSQELQVNINILNLEIDSSFIKYSKVITINYHQKKSFATKLYLSLKIPLS